MRVLIATVCACLVFAAGAQALGKTELASQANTICAKYTKKLNRLSMKDDQRYLDNVASLAAEQLEQLEGLKATGKVKKLYARFVARYADATQVLADIAAANEADDAEELQALTRDLKTATVKIDKVAGSLGAPACGK